MTLIVRGGSMLYSSAGIESVFTIETSIFRF